MQTQGRATDRKSPLEEFSQGSWSFSASPTAHLTMADGTLVDRCNHRLSPSTTAAMVLTTCLTGV